jgi:hypothetical protein
MRFEGQMNVDINDIVTNLVPFPKMNIIGSSMNPQFTSIDMKPISIDSLFTDIFSPHTQLLSVNPRHSMYFFIIQVFSKCIDVQGKD